MKTTDSVFKEWLDSRPDFVQEKVMLYPPGTYRMKDTGQIVSIYGYEERSGKCETCKVVSLAKDSGGHQEEDRLVFGVEFSNLEKI